MDTRLLDLLVCPICKGPLQHLRPPTSARHELLCEHDKLAFPVRDGIPILLENEARDIRVGEPDGGDTPAATASVPPTSGPGA